MYTADSLKILYVDDSEATLAAVAQELARHGHEVHTAQALTEASAVVASCELVIVDFHMPGNAGDEVLKALRPRVESDATLFYLYTVDRDVAASFRTFGFDGAFIGKGDATMLPGQIEVAARRIQLREMRKRRRSAG